LNPHKKNVIDVAFEQIVLRYSIIFSIQSEDSKTQGFKQSSTKMGQLLPIIPLVLKKNPQGFPENHK
jgi:hypothetical protein